MDDIKHDVLSQLIGFHTLSRPLESWYAFVSRLTRANLLGTSELTRHLPVQWIRWAFKPHEVDVEDVAGLDGYLAHLLPGAELKLRPDAWQVWPDLSSVPRECLRACPSCLQAGYHSYAMQCDLLARCPVHHEELTYYCPQCRTPMLWSGRVLGTLAFQCPAGCSLVDGIHCGLHVPYEAELSSLLDGHATWLQTVRNSIDIVSGPAYIAYPPHLVGTPGAATLPSRGLSTALLQKLLAVGAAVPPLGDYHEQSAGRWVMEVQPWRPLPPIRKPELGLEGLRGGFRRGPFRTYLPLVDPKGFERWLRLSEKQQGNWHGGGVERGSTSYLFRLNSHLITNMELVGLRGLLMAEQEPALAFAHYQRMLIDVLERALHRDAALRASRAEAAAISIAESFDAIVLIGKSLWRASGYTRASDNALETWLGYQEPAGID